MPDTGATGVASTDWRHREIRKMTKHPYRMLTLGLLLSPATTTLAATAQIEEVVVTAQKRSESAQEIPIAINAYGSDALEMKGANDISGLATTVPALTFAPYPSSSGALIGTPSTARVTVAWSATGQRTTTCSAATVAV